MEHVKALLKLWKADKHIPDGESIKSLLPKKDDEVKALHGLAMQPDLVSAVKMTLSTLQTAWSLLETSLCISDDPVVDMDADSLTQEELLIIAKVVPLLIPVDLARSLQPNSRKRKHEGSDDDSGERALSLEEILDINDKDDDLDFSGFFGSRSLDHKEKRTRVNSVAPDESEDRVDESDGKSRSERSDSSDVVLVGVKPKNKDGEERKIATKGRKLLKPKSRRRQSDDTTTEQHIKEEKED